MFTTKACPAGLAGLRVLVVGLGRFGGGVGVTRWLMDQGAKVTVTDRADAASLEKSLDAVADLNLTIHLGGHDLRDLEAVDLAIINPAVNKTQCEFFWEIVRRGIAWTTEINLFCQRCPAGIIGVTGTFGKSTTCTMLADALRATCGTNVYLGGNIGGSLLLDLPRIRSTDIVVLEMSNAQLEDLPDIHWAPSVAVITNLFPHHLDRYAGFAEYVDAKLNIIRDPKGKSTIIIGDFDPKARAIFEHSVSNGAARVRHVRPPDPPVVLQISGVHNQSNAACVLEVCAALGLDEAPVRDALRSFKGLPHRLQHVRMINGVDYVNDSKATSPTATIAALASFDRPVIAIVGGQDKNVSLIDCATALVHACRAMVCIGECGPKFAEAARSCSPVGSGVTIHESQRLEEARVPLAACPPVQAIQCTDESLPEIGVYSKFSVNVYESQRLDEALRLAHALAQPGDVVLFAPGAPSFDAYANYAERGDHFVDLVNAM